MLLTNASILPSGENVKCSTSPVLPPKVRTVAPNLSFTRPENLHLTLKFLGEVPDAAVTSGITPSAMAMPRRRG